MSDTVSNDKDRSDRHRSVRRRLLLGGLGMTALGAGTAGALLGRTPVGLLEGRSRARPVQGDSVPPQSVDVVVIGGGNVGTAAALTLAERGVSVALCEKGVIAGEASGRSMGYVDSQLQDPEKFELIARSRTLWSQLNARIGQDTGFRPTGLVEALDGPQEQDWAQMWLTALRDRPGADGRILTRRELAKLFPDMVDPPAAAMHTPNDASVEPQLAAPAMADGARRKGAKILQQCAVRGLETRAGRVCGVVTEKGPIACRAVVLAGGAWSTLFARSLGVQLPQLDMSLSMCNMSAVSGPEVPFSAGYGFRRQIDGHYSVGYIDIAVPIQPTSIRHVFQLVPAMEALWPMVHIGCSPADFWHDLWSRSKWPLDQPSPFEARRIMVPQFNAAPLERGVLELRRHFPVFATAQVRERWAGVMSSTLDNMPIISEIAEYPGLYVGTAFINGLTMGPAAGEALADLATGRKPQINLHPYRLSRFHDGSPITFHA